LVVVADLTITLMALLQHLVVPQIIKVEADLIPEIFLPLRVELTEVGVVGVVDTLAAKILQD
jgi:hypothetical protein